MFSLLAIIPGEEWQVQFGKQLCTIMAGVAFILFCIFICTYIYNAVFLDMNAFLKLKKSNSFSQVISFNHSWTIENATALFEDQVGDRHPVVSSPRFGPTTNDPVQFSLQIYPHGLSAEYEDHVSVYLNLDTTDKEELEVLFEFSIVDANGKKVNSHGNSSVSKFCRDNLGWGLNTYIRRATLLNLTNGYLPDNTLTIYCEVLMVSTFERAFSQPRTEQTMDFADLLENEQFSDLVLAVGDKQFPAHKVILANRSPVLAEMIRSEVKDSAENCRLDITEIEMELFCQLLAFIYTGKVPQIDQFAAELLPLAEEFQVDNLKTVCEQHLSSKLTAKSVLDQLRFAENHSAKLLRAQALDFMRKQISSCIKANQDRTQLVQVFKDLVHKE